LTVRAVKAATTTIPLALMTGDPFGSGVVAGLA
jgi:hypothetical protein